MNSFQVNLTQRLQNLENKNQLRKLTVNHRELVDFNSNDYLGLARSEQLFSLIQNKVESVKLTIKNGATGSRLLSGNSDYTEQVEQKLATLFKSERALIFNSGYTASLGVLSSLPQWRDTIIYDELAHACIKDGARLSMATKYSFKHNDLNDLEKKIKKAKGRAFIAVESIYSMNGDACPLNDLTSLARRYDAVIILDEAHSTGVTGPGGSGAAVSVRIENQIPVRIYTFGKAMGVHGACVAGSAELIENLINFARPFIYTTTPPPHAVASIDCAFDYLRQHDYLQASLDERVKFFARKIGNPTNRTPSNSAIQGIIVPGNSDAKNAAQLLQEAGFDVRAILSPTVREGTERLRISLHVHNTLEEIASLADTLTTNKIIH